MDVIYVGDIGWIELPIYEGNVLDTKSNEIPSLF
jgi:hypothetical protein